MNPIRDEGMFQRAQEAVKEVESSDNPLVDSLQNSVAIVRSVLYDMQDTYVKHLESASTEAEPSFTEHLNRQTEMIQEALDTIDEYQQNLGEAADPDLSTDDAVELIKGAVKQYQTRLEKLNNKYAPKPSQVDKDNLTRLPGDLPTVQPSLGGPNAPPQIGALNAPQGTAALAANKPKVTIVKGMDQAGYWAITQGSQPTSGPPLETTIVYAPQSQASPTASGSIGDKPVLSSALNSSTLAARAKMRLFWDFGSPDVRCGSQHFQSIRFLNIRGFETPRSIAPVSKDAMVSAVDTFVNTSLSPSGTTDHSPPLTATRSKP